MPKRIPVEKVGYNHFNPPPTVFWMRFPGRIEFAFTVDYPSNCKTMAQKTKRVEAIAKTLCFYCANPTLPEALSNLSKVLGSESAVALLEAMQDVSLDFARGWLEDANGVTWAEIFAASQTYEPPNIRVDNIEDLIRKAV